MREGVEEPRDRQLPCLAGAEDLSVDETYAVSASQRVAITPRDRELAAWVTRHGMVTAEQICRRFFMSLSATRRRLRRLESVGLIRRDLVWAGVSRVVRTTGAGARFGDVDLGPAPLDYVLLRHNLAVVDLSEQLLEAHAGAAWLTERELRRDRARAGRDASAPRQPTPDGVLLLLLPDPRRVAIELDLTPKRSRRLDQLVTAYADDRQADAVWWFLPSETAMARMRDVVRARGLEHLVEPRLRRLPRT